MFEGMKGDAGTALVPSEGEELVRGGRRGLSPHPALQSYQKGPLLCLMFKYRNWKPLEARGPIGVWVQGEHDGRGMPSQSSPSGEERGWTSK